MKYKKFLPFIALAILSFVFFFYERLINSGHYLRLNYSRANLPNTISLLVLLLFIVLSVFKTFEKHKIKWLRPLMFSLILFLTITNYVLFLIGLLFLSIFYFLIKKTSGFVSVLLTFLFAILFGIYSYDLYLKMNFISPVVHFLILLIKSCITMRLISWVIDRKVYLRKEHDTYFEYLEYMLFPPIFIFPGQIQFIQYTYFHNSKNKNDFNLLKTLATGFWGLLSLFFFYNLDKLFWDNYNEIPNYFTNYSYLLTQIMIGFYWLIVVYFLQASGAAIQVSLSWCLGYSLKYDMHWPLLTRTPIEYLKNHSSYIKDYIIDVGYKPLSVFVYRKFQLMGWQLGLIATSVYALFIGLQSGFRPDYNRGILVTWSMIGCFIFFLLYEKMISLIVPLKFRPRHTALAHSQNSLNSIKNWKYTDYIFWIINILLLSCYKAILGLAMSLSQRG